VATGAEILCGAGAGWRPCASSVVSGIPAHEFPWVDAGGAAELLDLRDHDRGLQSSMKLMSHRPNALLFKQFAGPSLFASTFSGCYCNPVQAASMKCQALN
jgi:hypothetical protein